MVFKLDDYAALIETFLNRHITVKTFEEHYLRMFKDDTSMRPQREYETLNRLFSDIDAFSEHPTSPNDLDEAVLRAAAGVALAALAKK